MANKKVCIFCGEKPGLFRASNIVCGGTLQLCCVSCENELKELTELEQCHRALRLGLAEDQEKIEARIDVLTNSETHRPMCMRCNTKLKFGREQRLDNTPLGDGIFSDTFDVVPAYCSTCGKIEFYSPDFIRRNQYLAHLVAADTDQ